MNLATLMDIAQAAADEAGAPYGRWTQDTDGDLVTLYRGDTKAIVITTRVIEMAGH